MIDSKYLSTARFTTVESGAKLQKVRTTKKQGGGDFMISDLSEAVNTDEINQITVQSWLAKAQGRKSTLVFCVDIDHASNLTAMFRAFGVDARFITSLTSKVERSDSLDAFKRGEFPVLLNCGIFTEGTDIPNIDCVVMARPTQSRNLLVQMIGRGLRLHPGKKDCHVIDMVASLKTGIVTSPTLFGLDPSEIVDDLDTDAMKDLKREKDSEKAIRKVEALRSTPEPTIKTLDGSIIFQDYDNVTDLVEETSGDRFIRRMSRYSWVQVDENRYILSNQDGSYLSITKTEGHHLVMSHVKFASGFGGKTLHAKPRTIAQADSLENALHAADTFAKSRFSLFYINSGSSWRRVPASERQLAFLNKSRPADRQLTSDTTKGAAADMITKLMNGAKGRFNKINQAKRKEEAQNARWASFQNKLTAQNVRVGPVA